MLAFSPPVLLQATAPDLGRMLRADALHLALGILLVGVGLVAVVAYARRLRGQATVLWFGVFAFLYGLRLLARTGTVPLASGLPARFWVYAAAGITYVIVVPGMLFARAAVPRWRRLSGLAAAGLTAFARGGGRLGRDLRRPFSAETPNNLIAIALIAAGPGDDLPPGPPPGRDLRTLRVGVACIAGTAVVDNLRGLGAAPGRGWRWSRWGRRS